MKNEIMLMITQHKECQRVHPSQAYEPLQPLPEVTMPVESLSVDLLEANNAHFLCPVDRYSSFPFVHKLRSMSTSVVTSVIDSICLDYSYCRSIISDNEPQF